VDINTNVVKNYQTAEYGKFVELKGTEFPPVSVVRMSYPDTSSAFPSNSGLKPLSSVDIYPKYAILTHIANPEDIKVSLSAGNINVSLDQLEMNTDEIEDLIKDSNTRLTSLTSQVLTINQSVSGTNKTLQDILYYTNPIHYRDTYSIKTTSQGPTSAVEIGEATVFSIHGTSYAGYDQYLQMFNTATGDPSDTIIFSQLIKAGSNFNFEFPKGFYTGAGMEIRNSLTPTTNTPGNNDLFITVNYYQN
jgi:hypothetical protein